MRSQGGGGWDWSRNNSQLVEGVLAGIVPDPGFVFICDIDEGASNVTVITNKLSVEVGKSKERMDVLYFSHGWPVSDPIQTALCE